jgi:hypothetical protein
MDKERVEEIMQEMSEFKITPSEAEIILSNYHQGVSSANHRGICGFV